MMPYFEIAGEERKRLFSLKNNRREVLWEITGNCNQQCRYCYDTRTLGVQIDRQRAMDICQMIREHRWEHVHITGGETLLFPDLAEICDALSAHQVYLTTNLTLLGERDGGRGIEGVRRRVGAIIEAPALFPSFTAEQNLKMRCMAVGADESVVPRALEQAGLGGTGGKKVKDFSLGMRQRLGIATALLGDPEFLILDEPVNGLDPQGIVEVRELLLRLNRERGLTVLVSSHILGELSRLAGRFGFIERGRLLREISAAELEEACGRRLVLHMNGIVRFGEAMEKLGIRKFRAVSPTVCEVETDLSVSALAFALREVGLEILRVAEKEADLEGYFMRLIGGEEV